MTSVQFLSQCEEILASKPLTPLQMQEYHKRLLPFTGEQRARLYEHIVTHLGRFPRIADIMDAARELGLLRLDEYRPHAWQDTDCPRCGGSGRVIAVFRTEYASEAGRIEQTRILTFLGPYERSAERTDGDRYIFRCDCPAGEAPTVEHGIPRWSTGIPPVSRRIS